MLSIGSLIWISIRPIIRLVLCVSAGFALTALDILSPSAARGAGQIILNITLPCLMFSKIVPSFDAQNVVALGPLILVGFIYEILGGIFAWMIREMFYVPHRFRYGILVAGAWGNWGDIPTAVIMSVTASAPFSASDQNLAVAYISALIFVFMFTLFPMGGHKLIAKDFVGPDREPNEIRASLWCRLGKFFEWFKRKSHPGVVQDHFNRDPEKAMESIETKIHSDVKGENAIPVTPENIVPIHDEFLKKRVSFYPEGSTALPTEIGTPSRSEFPVSRFGSPAPTITHVDDHPFDVTSALTAEPTVTEAPPLEAGKRVLLFCRIRRNVWAFLKSLLAPSTLSILLSLPISLITPLKALFVEESGAGIPNAPDGQPPLAFILDTATFIAGASVPLGLFCLGNALANMKLPRGQWRTLPLGAIFWFAITKMVVTPILGVLICQGLSHAGIMDPNDKVLRFVAIFFSCVPTATTQVYLTQVYSGTGTAEHLSPFLIPQYILMFISMPILTVYTLSLLY